MTFFRNIERETMGQNFHKVFREAKIKKKILIGIEIITIVQKYKENASNESTENVLVSKFEGTILMGVMQNKMIKRGSRVHQNEWKEEERD